MEPRTKKWLIWGGIGLGALLMLWLLFRGGSSSSPSLGVGGVTFQGSGGSSLAGLGAIAGGIPGVKINPGNLATGTHEGGSVASTSGAGSTAAKQPAPPPAKPASKPVITPVTPYTPATGPGSYNPGAGSPPPGGVNINPGSRPVQP